MKFQGKKTIGNYVTIIISLLAFTVMNSQVKRYLGAISALQKSEIIRAVPQESNGYLIMHDNERVDHWVVNAMSDGKVVKTYKTASRENHVRMEHEVFNDWAYSYKIMGVSETGQIVLDTDVMPMNGDPVWIYNDCNRPTCVTTSGPELYAYGMEVLEHYDNDSYRLKLQKAWSHIDAVSGFRIPYYIEVSTNNLTTALSQHGHTYIDAYGSPQTYFPNGNGMYKVALGMGVWKNDIGISTDPMNGLAGEGCSLSFQFAKSRMNAYAPLLSTPLQCNGQTYSNNEAPGGGSGPFAVGAYILESLICLEILVLTPNTDDNGIVTYTWTYNTNSSLPLPNDCTETASPNGDSPCPPGYVYAPGGEDPCQPIAPILDKFRNLNIIPIDVQPQDTVDSIAPGLYVFVLNFDDGISVPIYKKIETRIPLEENGTRTMNGLTIFPNPTTEQVTVSVGQEENIVAYSIFNDMGHEVRKGDFSSKSNQQILDVDQLKNGIYFLTIKTDSNMYTEKMIHVKR